MKKFLALASVALFAVALLAGEVPITPNRITSSDVTTLLTFTTATNATGANLDVSKYLYHTFTFSSTSTNVTTFTLRASLDGSVFAPLKIVSIAANQTTNDIYTVTGPFAYVQCNALTTNATLGAVKYLGRVN